MEGWGELSITGAEGGPVSVFFGLLYCNS